MTRRRLPSPPAGQLHTQTMRWDPRIYAGLVAYAAAKNVTVSYAVHLLVEIGLESEAQAELDEARRGVAMS